jgi:hypothetical protein
VLTGYLFQLKETKGSGSYCGRICHVGHPTVGNLSGTMRYVAGATVTAITVEITFFGENVTSIITFIL